VKKILAILLLLVYTAASSGTVMSAHFCMGELAGVSIGEKEQDACGYCGMDDAGCCHDLLQVVKLDDSQMLKTSSVVLENNLLSLAQTVDFFRLEIIFDRKEKIKCISPLKYGDPPIYLRNCVFRI
jgi:hypothetical protein